jgi:hypothetical protein
MIPLYSLYTPSHREIKERFFVPTVPADVDLRLTYFENEGEGWIHDPSFCRAIIRKCEIIVDAIRENWGKVFVWSDVDTQFFGPLTESVLHHTRELDLVFQIDAPGPCLCDGFFFCRGNEETLRLWEETLQFVREPDSRGDDQFFVRNQLWYGNRKVRWGHLPPAFIGGGTFTGQCWDPGGDFPVPRGMVMHHANFTAGPKFKVMQFEFVLGKIARGDLISLEEASQRLSNNHTCITPSEPSSGKLSEMLKG